MPLILEKTADSDLARAIKSSDANAFKVLYYRYYEQLYTFLWRRTQDGEISKDLVQELFMRLWNNRHNLDSRYALKSYLYKIGHNLVIDHLRKKGVEQTLFVADPPDEKAAFEENEHFELKESIDAAIRELPEPVRTVFCMSRFEGLKYTEIAETLEISVKTVEARMSKALAILRRKLKPFLA
jgi:RNA polymerase sigma-70 factor (ECF subfamily)